MIVLMLGYFVMGLIFTVVRFFQHVLYRKNSQPGLVRAVRNDFLILYAYAKQIIVSNPKKFKTVGAITLCLIILPLTPLQIEIEYIIEDFLAAIMFSLLVIRRKKIRPTKNFPSKFLDLFIQSSLCITAREIWF